MSDLDFIITDADKAAHLAEPVAPDHHPAPARAAKVQDVAETEGFEYKERKLAMSLDALISETTKGKGKRGGGGREGHGGEGWEMGGGGGAGPMRRQPKGWRGGGGGAGPRAPRHNISLTVDNRGPTSYGVLFREFELLGVEEGHVTLNSGGERTPLMFAALNTALAPFGYRLTEQASKPGEWMVAGQSKFMRFSDGLVLHGAARFAEQGAAAFASQAHGAGYGHGVDGHYGGDDRYGGGRGGGGRGGGGRGPYVQRQMIPQHQEEAAQRRPRQPQPGDAPMATQSSSVFSRLGARAAPY